MKTLYLKKALFYSRLVMGLLLAKVADRLANRAVSLIKNAEKGYPYAPVRD